MNRSSFLCRCAAVSLGAWFLEGCGGSGGSDTPNFRYSVDEIVTLPFIADMVARNRQGYSIGSSSAADFGTGYEGFLVSPEGAFIRVPNLQDVKTARFSAINNTGKAVGSGSYSSGVNQPFVHDIPTGVTTPITALNSPRSINDANEVLGVELRNTSGPGPAYSGGLITNLATGATETLPDPEGDTYFTGTKINNSGLVVGGLGSPLASEGVLALYDLNTRTLRTIPAGIYPGTWALFVSDSGKITGVDFELSYDPEKRSRVFLFDSASGGKTYLPELPQVAGGAVSFPLNASGDGAIGTSYGGFVYRQGRIQEINSTLSADDQKTWKIWQTYAIDDSGIIYAVGDLKGDTTAPTTTSLLRLTPQ
ncbi:MAG: hypothetical protein V4671_00880 [Armatimonadota bacterium]